MRIHCKALPTCVAVRLMALAMAASAAGACTNGVLSRLATPASPYEAYADTLRRSALDQAALGRDWLAAGQQALDRAMPVDLPFRESGYFAPDRPTAVGYRLPLRRGRTLVVDATFESVEPGRLFVDLFRIVPGKAPERISSMAPATTTLTASIDDDGDYVLRLQAELLRGGRYDVAQRTMASLPFPVPGLSGRVMQSLFGAERDAGVRLHEGVDIFAPRGTPVVAVAAGVAQPSTNNLGGIVVWLQDARRRRTYYYAHLDRTAITGTTTVDAGAVLGYVGNTGNARTTSPHLHFGIYAGGAIDPQPFLAADQAHPPRPDSDLPPGSLARVRTAQATLRFGAAAAAPSLAAVARGTPVTVVAAAARTLRVRLPDGATGYLPEQAVVAAASALSRRTLARGDIVRERPFDPAPAVSIIADAAVVDVLGRFGGYDLVRGSNLEGWVTAPARARP